MTPASLILVGVIIGVLLLAVGLLLTEWLNGPKR